ncbi:MAG: Gfo/Idh/MocA family oxidoreductase [Acetobacteraceae bacterium]|nr:Gfo/Idh/MocA family oxidoreductase [Acetobacteraceae bacterium]
MRQINMGVIGAGWIGGIRAVACAASPQIGQLHICDIREDRLAEVAKMTNPASAVTDYRRLLDNKDIEAIFLSTAPESTHYPLARDCILAGKHVLMEKPIAARPEEADELIAMAAERGLKFTVGYSQRFNPKMAYVRRALQGESIGKPVTIMVSRNVTRSLGSKISGRTKLSPAAMEATHDIDWVLWALQPRKPVRVYSQSAFGVYKQTNGAADHMWMTITMDDGVTFTIGAGWILPPGYPNYCVTTIEVLATEGVLFIDDSHKDVILNSMEGGVQFPMSSMPGEEVDHVFVGPMGSETHHFINAVAQDREVLVKPAEARLVMDCYMAADLSAETHEPVTLPRNAPLPARAA